MKRNGLTLLFMAVAEPGPQTGDPPASGAGGTDLKTLQPGPSMSRSMAALFPPVQESPMPSGIVREIDLLFVTPVWPKMCCSRCVNRREAFQGFRGK
jgi:hypothetical protein